MSLLKKTNFSPDELPIFDDAIIYKRGKYWQFRMWLAKEVTCRIFCTSVSETTALLALHPDGVTEAQKSAALAVDIPAMNGV